MRRLFRSFEQAGLRYLLVSGQASVLYGAAMFSEDVDILISPEAANAARLLRALARCGARVHKLTPPLEGRYLRGGHGFHFTLSGGASPVYLDVMARPPRVGSFAAASARASWMDTDWGRVPVIGIMDLIPLKMTRRLSDYEVISNLVRIRLSQETAVSRRLLRWAARYSFRAEDRVDFLGRLGIKADVEDCRRQIAAEVARRQERYVRYWRPIIDELRLLRLSGRLLESGRLVAEVIGRPKRARP